MLKHTIATIVSGLTLFFASSLAAAEDTVALQDLIDRAISAHESKLVIPRGIYRVTPPKPQAPHLTLRNAKDLTIDATGVTLVCTTLNQAVRLDGCSNVTIVGLTIDYDPLPFTQGTITRISDDDSAFDIKLHDGYPTVGGKVRGIVIDPVTRVVKNETWSRFSGNATSDATGAVHVDWGRPIRDAAKAGDLVVLTGPTLSPHGIFLTHCARTTLDSVTVHASTSFAIIEVHGDANTYRNVRIVPGPTPPGATEARLLSSNADGIHSKHASKGPTIERCDLNATGDDGIAINGDFAMIVRASGARSFILAPSRELTFKVGDRVRGFDEQLVPTELGRIVEVRSVEPTGENDPRPVQQRRLPELRYAEHLQKQTYEVTLDRELKLSAGSLMSSPDRNGSGFAVRGCTIRNNRARGILVKASEGVIEGNTIEASALAGIVLSPECEYWLEADYSRDVVIRENTLRRVGCGSRNPGAIQAGAISVVADSKGAADGHQNIVIERNTVEDSAGCSVVVMSANGVTLRQNKFIRPGHLPYGTGSKFGVDGTAVVWISQAKNITLDANTTTDPGPNAKSELIVTETVSDVVRK